ncbi:hypothetical protein EYF80_060864 [Liparis tanakae]|uniref:Uncharacterized protein n=1 Tax=Liparis tanakae TaxID=230148 RepID=A0A4Z2EJ65_9TELE|nr:hypothetical protein EYF80_060864 [Liparis tanakae]
MAVCVLNVLPVSAGLVHGKAAMFPSSARRYSPRSRELPVFSGCRSQPLCSAGARTVNRPRRRRAEQAEQKASEAESTRE